METLGEAREKISAELTSDDLDVRTKYLTLFKADAEIFSGAMARAFMKWRSLDAEVKRNDDSRAYVSALVYTAISLHISSMKHFLSGHAVAAGCLFRQVIEWIALALVCSGKELQILERFMADKYSTNDAVRDVLRYWKGLGLTNDGVEALRDVRDFYHKYSHPSPLTIATVMSFSNRGSLYFGAAFDEGKIEAYRKEASARITLTKEFPSFVDTVTANVAKW